MAGIVLQASNQHVSFNFASRLLKKNMAQAAAAAAASDMVKDAAGKMVDKNFSGTLCNVSSGSRYNCNHGNKIENTKECGGCKLRYCTYHSKPQSAGGAVLAAVATGGGHYCDS